MMSGWACYFAGLATLPIVAIICFIIWILVAVTMDTIDKLKSRTLKPGYGRWHWLYIYPRVWIDCLMEPLKKKTYE